MDLRSAGRKLSFDVLSGNHLGEECGGADSPVGRSSSFPRSKSDPIPALESDSPRKKRKHRKKKSNKQWTTQCSIIMESPDTDNIKAESLGLENGNGNFVECDNMMSYVSEACQGVDIQSSSSYGFGELRQRSFGNNVGEENESVVSSVAAQSRQEDKDVWFEVAAKHLNSKAACGGDSRPKLETVESLDWKQVISEDPHSLVQLERSPLKYFMEEMTIGHSLRSTTIISNEKERERVYDTIFRLPWRCELLIDVGVFICFDSFLSLLTIMPARMLTILWKSVHVRQLKKLSSTELSDLGSFIVLVCGVTLLQQIDISLIYHMIRGQATIKLYVVYNVLEIFDKLCQSFGGDVLQTLLNSADGLDSCLPENKGYWMWRYGSDLALAVAASIVHSVILLVQGVALSACIVAHNNALLALLVSNNFAEIKSNVFKRFSKDNIQRIVYSDSVERFHISAFMLFVLAQNILEAENPWFGRFIFNAMMVYVSEIAIDIIKHSFISNFNDIKPTAYSEFLEDLCKQTLNLQTNAKNGLTFIPLAPACVVIRVLLPVYEAHLPCNPLLWRFFWIVILFVKTYIMLASLKAIIRIGLQKHAAWYVKRCEKRKLHSD